MKISNQYIYTAITSLGISIFLLFAGYFSNNMSLFTGESLEALAAMETFNYFAGNNFDDNSDVIYINTSFDKELIDYYEINEKLKNPNPVLRGKTEITDRKKLISLLELLKNVNYKYLIIDLKFSKGLKSDSFIIDSVTGKKEKTDDKLFSLIKEMDRVVVATLHDIKLIDNGLERISGLADYRATATATNFVRYEYFDSIPYVPLVVYNELNKRANQDTIACYYPLGKKCLKPFAIYKQGNDYCYNSLFLDFRIAKNKTLFQENGKPFNTEIEYLNLSQDILEVKKLDPQIIVDNFENKYVFVGNITQDLHDTYAGPLPGCVILYKAIKALNENKHIVSPIELLVLLLLYFFISFFILRGKNILDIFKKTDNSLLNFIIDITSFSIVLSLYHFVEYMLGRTSYSFIIPMIIFTMVKTFVLLKKQYKMKNFFLILFVALLSGLLMSFSPKENDRTIMIHAYNSCNIRVDGKLVSIGMMISPKSVFSFTEPSEEVVVINTGDPIKTYCSDHKRVEIWNKGEFRKIQNKRVKSPNLFWWVTYHGTIAKGIDNVEYFIGEERPFPIEDVIEEKNRDQQSYVFEVKEGKFKGKKIKADYDNADPVIWLSRDLLTKNGIILDNSSKSDTLVFKLIYHNFGQTIIIKDSLKIIFVK